MTQLDMGKDLQQRALDKSKRGREERIAAIRKWLWESRDSEVEWEPTADDVWMGAEMLGLTDGDTRWLGSVLRSWDAVRNTGRYTPSKRKVNHARPIPIFRWV